MCEVDGCSPLEQYHTSYWVNNVQALIFIRCIWLPSWIDERYIKQYHALPDEDDESVFSEQ